MIGQVIDTYKIEEVLGHGGMGVVYRATDISLEKVVALKVMNPVMAQDPHFLGRFKAEARALGRLQHPNIVNVFAFRHIGEHLFIVMEFVEGSDLTEYIRAKGSIPWQEALPLMKQALRAIDYAHNEKVIHRDLKPRNIMLTRDQRVKVTDFGLAKIQAASSEALVATRTGFTGGTLYYMPPEQLEGLLNVDHRGDIYSLGMSFYEMLAGRTPFDKTSSEFKILKAIDAAQFPPVNELNYDVPPGLSAIIAKSIERDPADRYQTAQEMLVALDQWERNPQAHTPVPPIPDHEATILTSDFGTYPLLPHEQPTSSSFSNPGTYATQKGTTAPAHATQPRTTTRAAGTEDEKPSRSVWPMFMVGGIGVLLLAISAVYFLRGTPNGPPEPPPDPPEAAFASLSIRTAPADASVYVNGQTVGATPLLNWQAEPGENRVRIEKEGFASLDTALTVQPERDNAFLFVLRPEETSTLTTDPPITTIPEEDDDPVPVATGSLTVRSEPSGAQVLVDGRAVGETPFSGRNIPAGAHQIELRLDGYRTVRQDVQVRAGSANTVSQTLSRAQGTLRVVVRPYGDIYINGDRKAQETNAVYTEQLATGVYRVQARHPVLGSWEKQVRVADGETNEVLFNFRETYRVAVASPPHNNAQIILDGQPIEKYTPTELSLPPGQHTLAVRRDGFQMVGNPRQITVERDLTGSRAITFELRPTN